MPPRRATLPVAAVPTPRPSPRGGPRTAVPEARPGQTDPRPSETEVARSSGPAPADSPLSRFTVVLGQAGSGHDVVAAVLSNQSGVGLLDTEAHARQVARRSPTTARELEKGCSLSDAYLRVLVTSRLGTWRDLVSLVVTGAPRTATAFGRVVEDATAKGWPRPDLVLVHAPAIERARRRADSRPCARCGRLSVVRDPGAVPAQCCGLPLDPAARAPDYMPAALEASEQWWTETVLPLAAAARQHGFTVTELEVSDPWRLDRAAAQELSVASGLRPAPALAPSAALAVSESVPAEAGATTKTPGQGPAQKGSAKTPATKGGARAPTGAARRSRA